MPDEPCQLLVEKIREHNAITKCPYCKQLFDIHVGLIYLEEKEVSTPPPDTHGFFEKVMRKQ